MISALLKFTAWLGCAPLRGWLRRSALGGTASLALLLATDSPLRAQTLYVANSSNNAVGAYNATTGATLTSFTGLNAPDGLLVSGNTLYVANNQGGTVSEFNTATGALATISLQVANPVGLALSGSNLYVSGTTATTNNGVTTSTASIGVYNATSGAFVNTLNIAGLSNPQGLTMSGSVLYYTDANTGKIGAYDTTTGSTPTTFTTTPSGLKTPIFLAVSNGDLFVANQNSGVQNGATVGEYNAATGAAINANFITGLTTARGLAVSGNILYVSSFTGTGNNTEVSEYNISDGSLIKANFLTNAGANGLAISPVPEPATWLGGALLGAVAFNGVWRLRRGQRA